MITIPTLSQLYDNIKNDIETEFGDSVPDFGQQDMRVQIAAQAAALKIFYLFVGKLQKNSFVDQAEPEAGGGTLERWGRIKLGRDPFPATAAQYTVDVTGITGGFIPAQTTFKSDSASQNPGKVFILDSDYTLSGSSDTMTLRALDAGMGSALANGDTLTATQPLNGANQQVTVSATVVAPLAAEATEDYRAKIETSFRLEPQGGAAADFLIWGLDAMGVKKIYPYTTSGTSASVDIYVEANPEDSIDGKGTPGLGILTDVTSCIEQDPDTTLNYWERDRRPMGVFDANVLPVVVKLVQINITGFTLPDQQTAVTAALTEFVNGVRPYVPAVDTVASRSDVINTPKLNQAILNAAPGAGFTSVNMLVDSTPETSYQFDNGEIPYLLSVSFI